MGNVAANAHPKSESTGFCFAVGASFVVRLSRFARTDRNALALTSPQTQPQAGHARPFESRPLLPSSRTL
jgi:hypothetical protein